MTSDDLPLADGAPRAWRRQRDAASRNETAIVEAATELFRDRGVDNVDVREIAAAAGVGIGTVYRRFGDKASVIAAAIGEQERALQDAVLAGPPPLGPGAPPQERLAAFLAALCELTERNLDVLSASEGSSPGARYRVGAYRAWHVHVAVLLREIDQAVDVDWVAGTLLAPLAAEHYRHQRRDRSMSARRIRDNLLSAAATLTERRGRDAPRMRRSRAGEPTEKLA